MSATLVLTDVHKTWRGQAPVVDGVSLTMESGDVAWIGGRNGVGKTTLLRVAAGLIRPERGSVAVEGLDPERDRAAFQRRVGLLSAGDRGLFARIGPREHLRYCARLQMIPRSERDGLIDEAMELFRLGELDGRRADRLSMGQRQRLRLAMIFMPRPAVLLLDEPRNSLDDDGYAILNGAVESAASRGAAVLWCSPRGEDRVLRFDASYTLADGRLMPA